MPVTVPRKNLYEYSVRLDRVLDLTTPAARNAVAVSAEDLIADNHRRCQRIGSEAYLSGFQAVISFSSAGRDEIMAVFVGRTGEGGLFWELREEWPIVTY